jgi:DNA-binding CsgD family transcriptional regulator
LKEIISTMPTTNSKNVAQKGFGPVVFGYALLLFCEFVCVHSATIFARTNLPVRDQLNLFSILLLVTEFVVFVIAVCLRQRFSRRTSRVFIGIASLLMATGFVCIVLFETLGETWPDVILPLLICAAIALGLGLAVFCLSWARVFCARPPRELYRQVIFSYLLGLVLYLLLTFLPATAVVPFTILAVMGSAILLSLAAAPFEAADTPDPLPSTLKRIVRLLWRPLLCTAVFGFMSGLMSQVSAQGRLPLESFQQVSILASLIVVGILLLPALLLSKPLTITSAYRVALPIAAAGFLLLPFVWDTLFGLSNALVNMGLLTVIIILWCMLVATTMQTHLPVQTVFGACLAIIVGARLLGKVLGFIYESHLTQSFLSLTAVALVSIYLLSMLTLVFFKGQRFTRAHEAEGKGLKVVVWGEDRYQECCRHIAQSAGFTPRELEIFLLLGQGRSIANIANSLFVSDNTVKSHIRGVYSKLDVHSKQELIDLISDSLGSRENE